MKYSVDEIFKYYVNRVVEAKEKVPGYKSQVLMNFIKRYHSCVEHYQFFNKAGDLARTTFDKAWDKTDMTRSPGSPMCYLSPNNAGLVKFKGEIYLSTCERIPLLEELGEHVWNNKLFQSTHEEHTRIAAYLLQNGYTDPVLVSVKNEPRDITKRPRLVCQASILTTLVARILIGNTLIQEQTYDDIPTATRLDLTTPAKTEEFRQILAKQGELCTSDVQGWEYSVNEDDEWADCFKTLYVSGCMDDQFELIEDKKRHAYAIIGMYYGDIHRVVQLPSGKLVVTKAGIGSSGRLRTFSSNSMERSFLSELVSLELTKKPVKFVISAGDDNLDTNPKAEGIYLKYGKVITDYHANVNEYSFCSTRFTPSKSWQENIDKSFYAVCQKMTQFGYQYYREQLECQLFASYSNHPDFSKYWEHLSEFIQDLNESCE